MVFRMKLLTNMMQTHGGYARFYSSNFDFKKLKPMILKRMQDRAKDYTVKPMVRVANEVLKARMILIQGASTLLEFIPVLRCKFCPEVYVGGERGHLIQNCHGYLRRGNNRVHEWTNGGLHDILVPVETLHLNNMFQKGPKRDQSFGFDRVPAVVELCWQAGAHLDGDTMKVTPNSGSVHRGPNRVEPLSTEDLRLIANETLKAWETLRSGVQKLLLAYPSKVCNYCSEVHVGLSGHKALECGVFKYEGWRGTHLWKRADIDDLVPPKIMWCRRPQDPPVLLHENQKFYGHAPAVVDLCWKAGAVVPTKYYCMIKFNGLSPPVDSSRMLVG
ncbi:hypothetical protein K2173_004071 [Erythroxylum novogranatense]|uniref:APO domain-containing protein n=1 Tax=Erythroxylum novogranatense TaxID=1862640 RepID=A0AAV8SK53_9ROSI|nr:hypothetical protein K2173_004071 [Erythroxylum novogranatense]